MLTRYVGWKDAVTIDVTASFHPTYLVNKCKLPFVDPIDMKYGYVVVAR